MSINNKKILYQAEEMAFVNNCQRRKYSIKNTRIFGIIETRLTFHCALI
jgi:hypothetical protein